MFWGTIFCRSLFSAGCCFGARIFLGPIGQEAKAKTVIISGLAVTAGQFLVVDYCVSLGCYCTHCCIVLPSSALFPVVACTQVPSSAHGIDSSVVYNSAYGIDSSLVQNSANVIDSGIVYIKVSK